MQPAAPQVPLPPAWTAVCAQLAHVTYPFTPAAPRGAWEAGYRMLVVHRQPAAEWVCSPMGALRIRRGPDREGRFRMEIDISVSLPAGQQDRAQVTLTNRADAVGSLLAWERRSLFMTSGPGLSSTPVRTDTGSVGRGRIVREPGPSRRVHAPIVVNWTLFDTAGRTTRLLSFSLLEELDALHPGQTLRPHGEATVEMAGGPVRLRGTLQTGAGILPTTWWQHETGPPLLVLAGLRAYVLDPAIVMPEIPR